MPSVLSHLPSAIPSEQAVLDACHAADTAERDYALKATIAGALLMEYRESICSSHGGTSGAYSTVKHNQHTAKDNQFFPWLQKHGIARNTAYRWMDAAERVARFALNLGTGAQFTNTIDIEGIATPISQVLAAEDTDLSGRALAFKQSWFEFMKDKTLREAARSVIDGESPASRMTRAAYGKTKGGAGDLDRKDFALFAGRALSDCLSHIGASVDKKGGHWRGLNAAGKQQATQYLNLFLKGLPDELVEYLRDASKAECSFRGRGQRPEPLALKSVIDQTLGAKALSAGIARKQLAERL